MDIVFKFVYEPTEYARIIPAVLIDSRETIPAIKNQIGDVIKAYIDVEVNKVKSNEANLLFFKIETAYAKTKIAEGVLGGYFSLAMFKTGTAATLYQFQLRPAFVQFNSQISIEIINFITGGNWKQYYL